MNYEDEIYEMAVLFAPANTNEQILRTLCRAAQQDLAANLKKGVTMESCKDAFCCAGAFLALSMLPSQSDDVQSFRVGDVSVTTGRSDSASACLRTQAAMLMAPYSTGEFAFLGV